MGLGLKLGCDNNLYRNYQISAFLHYILWRIDTSEQGLNKKTRSLTLHLNQDHPEGIISQGEVFTKGIALENKINWLT